MFLYNDRTKFGSQISDNTDRWKSRGEKSQKKRVRRKKIPEKQELEERRCRCAKRLPFSQACCSNSTSFIPSFFLSCVFLRSFSPFVMSANELASVHALSGESWWWIVAFCRRPWAPSRCWGNLHVSGRSLTGMRQDWRALAYMAFQSIYPLQFNVTSCARNCH